MTQDEIIRSPLGREQLVALALEADIDAEAEGLTQALERFAALVREDEREACAKVCEEMLGVNNVSAAIRARGEK